MLFIAVAGANALEFTFVEQPKILALPDGADEHFGLGIKISAALSLVLWILVILAGRLLPIFASSEINLG
jgi:hypothetical protein